MSDEVSAFVEEHSDAEFTENGKVCCTVTGHECPARIALLKEYWSAKRYKTMKERATFNFVQYEPWIVPHKSAAHLMYCTLTKHPLTKEKRVVENHVNGKRFKRLLREQQEGKGPTKKKPHTPESTVLRAGDGEHDGEEEEEEEEDSVDEDDDAAEFLREGTFWEDSDDQDEDGDGAKGAATDDDDEEVFWTRPKITVVPEKKHNEKTKQAVEAMAHESSCKATEKHQQRLKAKKGAASGKRATAEKMKKAREGAPMGKRKR
jgi:hypothetical protein